jgi:hypothetical protein
MSWELLGDNQGGETDCITRDRKTICQLKLGMVAIGGGKRDGKTGDFGSDVVREVSFKLIVKMNIEEECELYFPK